MWSFLSRLDPNAVLAIATGLGTYIYHRVRGGTLRYLSQRDITALATQLFNASMAAAHHLPQFAPAAVALARAAVLARAAGAKQTLSPSWLAALDATLAALISGTVQNGTEAAAAAPVQNDTER